MGAVAGAMRHRSVSHHFRSSNRTCGSPASRSPTGFTVRHTAGQPGQAFEAKYSRRMGGIEPPIGDWWFAGRLHLARSGIVPSVTPAGSVSSVFLIHGCVHPLARHLEQLISKLRRRVVLLRELHAVPSVGFKLCRFLDDMAQASSSSIGWPFSAFCGTEFQTEVSM
jgi:hypothetical protein